jgi:lipopolysaccharide biosynthesis glycosyltransferase
MKTTLVLACDDNFIPFTAVVARRVALHATEKFPIMVVSDGVSDENKALARKFCPQIDFIEASSMFLERALPVSDRFSRAAHLRLFLDEILSDFDRVAYLDSDISPLTDVAPLLAMAPKVAPIIAAHDIHNMIEGTYRKRLQMSAPYFNSGVLVLDLQAIRTEHIFADALQYALDYPERCEFVDQDPLNAVLDGRWQTLDWRWNAMNFMSDLMPKPPFIRHFAGRKPWSSKKLGIEQRFVDEWRSDLAESPWLGRFEDSRLEYRVRNIYTPVTSAIGRFAKGWIYGNSAGRRGDRARLIKSFPTVLSAIEQSAAAGTIAGRIAFTEA